MNRGSYQVHFHAHRPQRRLRMNPRLSVNWKLREVRALCGKWVPARASVRHDAALYAEDICVQCAASKTVRG